MVGATTRRDCYAEVSPNAPEGHVEMAFNQAHYTFTFGVAEPERHTELAAGGGGKLGAVRQRASAKPSHGVCDAAWPDG